MKGCGDNLLLSMVGVQGVGYGGLSFQQQQHTTITIIIRLMMTFRIKSKIHESIQVRYTSSISIITSYIKLFHSRLYCNISIRINYLHLLNYYYYLFTVAVNEHYIQI